MHRTDRHRTEVPVAVDHHGIRFYFFFASFAFNICTTSSYCPYIMADKAPAVGPDAGVSDDFLAAAASPDMSATPAELDDNYALFKAEDAQNINATEANRVLRKIDFRVIPILFVTYLLQYLDKNGINYASVYGLDKGTGLVGQDYSWLGSIFYFGYLIGQYPAGYFLQRLPIAKVIGVTTVTWGVILITTPACHNFAGIAVNRFMLGLVESVINPGFVLIMSMWYTSLEQPLRLELYYCTNGVATMFGG